MLLPESKAAVLRDAGIVRARVRLYVCPHKETEQPLISDLYNLL